MVPPVPPPPPAAAAAAAPTPSQPPLGGSGAPSQAGRFKPRKPIKPASRGPTENTANPTTSQTRSGVPIIVPSSSHARGGRGRGRERGGGRTGRGGGRSGSGGRVPITQGQVFFTGTAASRTTSSAKRSATVSAGASRKGRSSGMLIGNPTGGAAGGVAAASGLHNFDATRMEIDMIAHATHEEVVGVLEQGIGERAGKPDAILSGTDPLAESKYENEEPMPTSSLPNETAGYTYDSDSSDEIISSRRKRDVKLQPVTLPFVPVRTPKGVGTEPPPSSQDDSGKGQSSVDVSVIQDSIRPSPFVSLGNRQLLQAEGDSWFLIQLPTRLPPIHQQPLPDTVVKVEPNTEETMDVSTPSIDLHAFDNVLTTAEPGRLGKIRVHRSGKTVLVLEADDGQPMIQMNIMEGLTCNFRQQAVAINQDRCEFTPLGRVTKTIVATPDLSRAFNS